jgi:glucose-1-phosphate thymidylyltransferase
MQAGADPNLTSEQSTAARKGDKAFMPVAGRYFIDFLIDALHDAGIRDICLVISTDRQISGRFAIVRQAQARGTADAVWSARDWAADTPFLVLNGDNLYPSAAIKAVAATDGPSLAGFDRENLVATSNFAPERIAAFAAIERDQDGNLKRIVEKPSAGELGLMPRPILVSMNLWKLDRRVLEACRDVAPSARGELELPSAVMLAAERGVRFEVVPATGPVLDLSSRADIADVTRRLGAMK